MRRQLLVSAIWITAVLFGCVSAAGPQSVQAGMSRQVLMSVMGRPDDSVTGSNYTALKWTEPGESGEAVDFWAILQDDVVVATGFGALQRDDAGNLTIIPLRR
jgi:hypothetical protein